MSGMPDVVVVGGGAIGCSVAYHIAKLGARVVLVEAEQVGAGASGALAGMLSGQGELEPPGPMLELMLLGRERHRELARELRESTGIDPGYVWDGALRTATGEVSEEFLAAAYHSQRSEGLRVEWLTGDEVRMLEPALSPRVTAGLYMPDDGQVNPPQLVQALARGAILHGARVQEATQVTGFLVQDGRVTGVRTTRGDISAGKVVLAGGAFSKALCEQLGIRLPIFPVKGQLLVGNLWPSPVKANVWGPGNLYIVPKRDGRIIIGATEEPDVYERRATLGGVADLSRAAVELVPRLAESLFVGAWSGLRPGALAGPILGPVEEWEGLLIATGHFRNGVLLSVVTGEIIGALVLQEDPPVDISPFLYESHLTKGGRQ